MKKPPAKTPRNAPVGAHGLPLRASAGESANLPRSGHVWHDRGRPERWFVVDRIDHLTGKVVIYRHREPNGQRRHSVKLEGFGTRYVPRKDEEAAAP